MSTRTHHRILFLHVMKTAGTSFTDIIRANVPAPLRYPDAILSPDTEMAVQMEAYIHAPKLIREVNSAATPFSIICGHVPYAVCELLDDQYDTVTILREPVARTISYLKHCQKYHVEHQGKDLETIYNDIWYFSSFMGNYQTKFFSMTPTECIAERRLGDRNPPLPARADFVAGAPMPEAALALQKQGAARLALELFAPSTGVIDADAGRLERAKKNLSTIATVGTTERYDAFLESIARRFGWHIPALPSKNVGGREAISAELRARIVKDTAIDRELYEFAKTIAA